MKILFDHQINTAHNYGGVARYFYELGRGLIADFNVNVVYPSMFSNSVFASHDFFRSKPFVPNLSFRGKTKIMNYFNERSSKNELNRHFDVFHPTYYDTYFLNEIGSRPFVITAYDLIHEKFSDQFGGLSANEVFFEKRKILFEKSTQIIAISNSTKNDLIDIYKVPSSKIDVVHLANSLESDNIIYPTDNNYILYVGARRAYKNFKRFAAAVSPLLLKEKDLKIVCAGGGKFNNEELKFLKNLHVLGQFKQISINDRLLSGLYSNALFFVFPSLYEGFGIPILEAFSCSCAAILSNTSSLSEVGGDAALYFDPYNEQDILRTITKLFYDRPLILKLKQAGLERQKMFSWLATVRKHYEIYKKLA